MEIFWESFRKFREKIQIEWKLRVRNFRKFGITFYKIAENADYTSQIFFLTLLSQVSLGRALYWCVFIFLFNFRVVGSFRITVYSS